MSCLSSTRLSIPGVLLIHPARIEDERGFFSETYNRQMFADAGIDHVWMQDNHALSCKSNTIRGLHYQNPPHHQNKLVRVVRGAVHDVVLDMRVGSQSYGQWLSVGLSAENWKQLFVPAGCAHGYMTLEANTEVLYKVDRAYAPAAEAGIKWSDPVLAIDWPLSGIEPVVSRKDQNLPDFASVSSSFVNDG